MTPTTAQSTPIAQRVAELDWTSAVAELDNVGIAAIGPLLGQSECHDLSALYDQIALFRSRGQGFTQQRRTAPIHVETRWGSVSD